MTGNNNTPQAGGGVQSLLIAVVPLILGWVQQQGGLQAALEKLKGAGLGSQVQSWVDPNQSNSEVPTQQLQSLFNPADIEQVAEQAQAPKEQVYGAIASVLPQVIDSLTPQGDSTDHQEANQDIQNVMNLVSGFKIRYKSTKADKSYIGFLLRTKNKGHKPFYFRSESNITD